MKRAVLVTTTNEAEEIGGDYESISAGVGGWIELVPLRTEEFVMFCDEEGKIKRLPLNPIANRIANRYRDWNDPLVGNIVLVGPTDSNGENASFSIDDYAKLMS